VIKSDNRLGIDVRDTGLVLVISRFRYDEALATRAADELASCLRQFAERPGYVRGTVGRAVDDPTLWVLATTWEHVGAYRRALSSYEIKVHVVPLLSYALDEPSAYEVIVGEGATVPNEAHPRGQEGV
jgi:Antibiotic biosynthesis monooxygenase